MQAVAGDLESVKTAYPLKGVHCPKKAEKGRRQLAYPQRRREVGWR